MKVLTRAAALALACGAVGGASIAAAGQFSSWGSAAPVDPQDSSGVNTPAQDGCPIQSPDGGKLYIASNRAGGAGGLDLWVATRDDDGDPWGEPGNPERAQHERPRVLPHARPGPRPLLHPAAERLRPGRHLLRTSRSQAWLERAPAARLRAERPELGVDEGSLVLRGGRSGAAVLLALANPRPGRGRARGHLRQHAR